MNMKTGLLYIYRLFVFSAKKKNMYRLFVYIYPNQDVNNIHSHPLPSSHDVPTMLYGIENLRPTLKLNWSHLRTHLCVTSQVSFSVFYLLYPTPTKHIGWELYDIIYSDKMPTLQCTFVTLIIPIRVDHLLKKFQARLCLPIHAAMSYGLWNIYTFLDLKCEGFVFLFLMKINK